MKHYLSILGKKKWLLTIVIGALAFSLILVFTLNLALAFFSLVIFSSLGVFQRSFHYGLVFFLAIILIFPSVYVIGNTVDTGELFVLILALIGVASLFVDRYKFKILPLFYYWAALISLIGGVLIFSRSDMGILYEMKQLIMRQNVIIFIVYPVLVISFQYFFQTTKRLEKFFWVVIFIGTTQAIIGIASFWGILGLDRVFIIESTGWPILLAMTIPTTLGMWLIQNSSLATLKFLCSRKKRKKDNKIIDVVKNNIISKESKKMVVNLKQSKLNVQAILISSLIIQILAIISISSYVSLIAVGIGIFIMGVLMRNKSIVLIVLVALLTLAIFLPVIEPFLTTQLKQGILDFWLIVKSSHSLEFFWQGKIIQQGKEMESSYLFVFNKAGLIGITIFILGLIQYFKEIREAYLKSDESERIWLVVILAIFVEFVFLGILSNVFFAWPVALLFWLLYGILQNLKIRKKEYRLMETIL